MIPATQTPTRSTNSLPPMYFESRIGEPGGGSARGPSRSTVKPSKKGGAKKGGAKKPSKKPGSKR